MISFENSKSLQNLPLGRDNQRPPTPSPVDLMTYDEVITEIQYFPHSDNLLDYS
jgi:hypothetical protein